MTHSVSSPLMEVLGIFVIAGFLLYARTQIASQRMTAGLFVAFIIALIKLYDPVRRMSGINNAFQQAFGASSRIFEILSLEKEHDTGQKVLAECKGSIEFHEVRFGYTPGQNVINGVSFAVQPGEVLAIVG